MIHKIIFRVLNADCEEVKHFFCEVPKFEERICPREYFPYKGKCLHENKVQGTLWENKKSCAVKGGIVMPIKTKGAFEFIKEHAYSVKAGNIYLGMNNTHGKMIQTDRTEYTTSSYDFDGNNNKFGKLQCVYLKKGIKYLPRETTCDGVMESYCQWISK